MNTEDIFYKNSHSLEDGELKFLNSKILLFSDEYKNFMRTFIPDKIKHNKILINRILEVSPVPQELYLGKFFKIEEVEKFHEYFYNTEPETEIIESNTTIIGVNNGRTYICIGIVEENRGHIFLWDGDFGVTKQAQSLSDFFNSLKLDEK